MPDTDDHDSEALSSTPPINPPHQDPLPGHQRSDGPRHDILRHDGLGDDSLPHDSLLDPGVSWLPSRAPHDPSVVSTQQAAGRDRWDAAGLPVLTPGEVYGDFLIRNELGRGAFGVVYFAEQFSLGRPVALKITRIESLDGCEEEGLALARLDHPSIVRVYSQTIDPERRLRTLCMQYVPGLTLRQLAHRLAERFGPTWGGKEMLEILDESPGRSVIVDDASLGDRAVLETLDHYETICWLGGHLAAALDHAHTVGIIHRDVKPENTIVNRFGRPLLVDFNLARAPIGGNTRSVGGTIPYMAPEVLVAFVEALGGRSDSLDRSPPDHRSDLYALGVMLWELAYHRRPFSIGSLDDRADQSHVQALFADGPRGDDAAPPVLGAVLRRAIAVTPETRFHSGRQFAGHLTGAARIGQVTEALRRRDTLGWSIGRYPMAWLFFAGVLPHLGASVCQILYNLAEIPFDADQKQALLQAIGYLNAMIYGVGVTLGLGWLVQVHNARRQGDRDRVRANTLRLPRIVAGLGGAGWLVGAIVFPTTVHFTSTPLPLKIWGHFFISFFFAGTMAVTYAFILMTAVVVLGYYPDNHSDVSQFRRHAERELSPLRRRWGRLTLMAGLIPLSAAIVLALTYDPFAATIDQAQSLTAFRTLMVLLVLAGAGGFGLLGRIGERVRATIEQCLRP